MRRTRVPPVQAVRIGYTGGRAAHRVVTLTGELVDTSGTMSGGGRSAKKGGMAASAASGDVTPEDIAAAEAAAAAANAALEKIRVRRATVAAELRELDRALPRLTTRLSKLGLDVAAAGRTIADLQGRADAAAARVTAARANGSSAEQEDGIAALAARVTALDEAHRTATAAAAEIERGVSMLQRDILEAGGERVRRAKARCDRASEAVESVLRAVTKARADARAGEKAVEKALKAIAAAQDELIAAEASLAKLVSEAKVGELRECRVAD